MITDKYIFFWQGKLSNFYRTEIHYQGLHFHSSEQLFMYFKAKFFNDEYHARLILESKTPKESKLYGRKVVGFNNEECDKVRVVGLEYEPLLIINVPTITLPNKDFVVIDDLCDGGRTFIELAKELRKKYPNRKKTLIVTHAVNLNGLKSVSEHYDKIIITDSYNDWESICISQNVIVKKCTDLIKI